MNDKKMNDKNKTGGDRGPRRAGALIIAEALAAAAAVAVLATACASSDPSPGFPQLPKWERCIQSHGEPGFSLPLGGQGQASGSKPEFNPASPQFKAALSACHHLLPPGVNISAGVTKLAS